MVAAVWHLTELSKKEFRLLLFSRDAEQVLKAAYQVVDVSKEIFEEFRSYKETVTEQTRKALQPFSFMRTLIVLDIPASKDICVSFCAAECH